MNFSSRFLTFLFAMSPLAEHRGSIPLGILHFHLPWYEAVLWSLLGNIIPIIIAVFALDPVSRFLRKYSKIADRFFHWLFARTRKRFTGSFKRWGYLALILFVAIPLPLTGGYSGAVAAFVFGIPSRFSIPLIFLGLIISSLIVTALTLGIFSLPLLKALIVK